MPRGDLLAAVGKVGANVQPRLLAELHLHDALVPACVCVLQSAVVQIRSSDWVKPTLDDAANANGRLERPAAGLLGRVKLLALAVLLAGLLEPAGVQHGDGVALLGGWAVALDENGLLDTHVACGACKVFDGRGCDGAAEVRC